MSRINAAVMLLRPQNGKNMVAGINGAPAVIPVDVDENCREAVHVTQRLQEELGGLLFLRQVIDIPGGEERLFVAEAQGRSFAQKLWIPVDENRAGVIHALRTALRGQGPRTTSTIRWSRKSLRRRTCPGPGRTGSTRCAAGWMPISGSRQTFSRTNCVGEVLPSAPPTATGCTRSIPRLMAWRSGRAMPCTTRSRGDSCGDAGRISSLPSLTWAPSSGSSPRHQSGKAGRSEPLGHRDGIHGRAADPLIHGAKLRHRDLDRGACLALR